MDLSKITPEVLAQFQTNDSSPITPTNNVKIQMEPEKNKSEKVKKLDKLILNQNKTFFLLYVCNINNY